ncbi:type ISP restriction/modification enzyme [Sphingopyxis panaciterrae]
MTRVSLLCSTRTGLWAGCSSTRTNISTAFPEVAWNFHIGGYQPAQKWLKDRRGRGLSWDDIGHYQKIVKILIETDRLMKEIELPLE